MHCSDAWLGLLRLPLPSDLLKQVLVQLHSKVLPSLPNPLLLSDFLSSCLDQGGLLGMLALNAIFTLVTKHGLEYPHFYARLYALLQVRYTVACPGLCTRHGYCIGMVTVYLAWLMCCVRRAIPKKYLLLWTLAQCFVVHW